MVEDLMEELELWLRTFGTRLQAHLEFWEERMETGGVPQMNVSPNGVSWVATEYNVKQRLDKGDCRVEEWSLQQGSGPQVLAHPSYVDKARDLSEPLFS